MIKRQWFKPWGWFYRPISHEGWFITLLTILFCLQVFIAVDRVSRSAGDTLYGLFPYAVPAFTVLGWVASHTSRKR